MRGRYRRAGTLAAMLTAGAAGAADPALLEAHVRYLAGLDPPRSIRHPESLDAAAVYIARHLQAAGWAPFEQVYTFNGNKYRNVRALKGPEDAPRVVIGAHYDVHGELPGADDNASGVAVLLALAAALADYQPEIGLELVAFTLEEQPAFAQGVMGSARHAQALDQAGVEVRAMLALEMLGYYRDLPGTQRFPVPFLNWFYPDAGNFVALIGRWSERSLLADLAQVMNAAGPLPVHYLASPLEFPGLDSSDHRNYWAQGWPALMVTDTAYYRNPNYHTRFDIPGSLDYRSMAALVPALASAVRGLTQKRAVEAR